MTQFTELADQPGASAAVQGVKFAPSMGYGLKLANPKEFFSESHRPSHFLEFSKLEVR